MKVVILGANGQLGVELCRTFTAQGVDHVPLTHKDVEVTNMASVNAAILASKPAVVINTAAFVRVDDCETNPDVCFRVNTLGARNVAVAAESIGARVVFVSTDYVYGQDSARDTPYDEFDAPAPINVLGRAKARGEQFVQHLCRRHYIVRISGLFGAAGSSGKGGNFIESIVAAAKRMPELRVVSDQTFSPSYSPDVARKISDIIKTESYGVFHVTNRGQCNWHEFATTSLSLIGVPTPIVPITTAEWKAPAPRPRYSVLRNYHLHLLDMDDARPWQDALYDYMKEKGRIK